MPDRPRRPQGDSILRLITTNPVEVESRDEVIRRWANRAPDRGDLRGRVVWERNAWKADCHSRLRRSHSDKLFDEQKPMREVTIGPTGGISARFNRSMRDSVSEQCSIMNDPAFQAELSSKTATSRAVFITQHHKRDYKYTRKNQADARDGGIRTCAKVLRG
ncbi:hypothetical protein BP00DRAFT_88631 [Aspergillus indologenus CBS 114.80]|uniref:Uncharacterized protein n=1 Tax=Aspergillus indologenus CBS 114.80 TaxID=1450541 RepID=A0A2V5IAZ9_9EURO|nr:hypothetical protein BP00DRAFT_88631 [Aspergillus indologenus CBS 114.80]